MSVQVRIQSRIRGKGRGAVFTPKDFVDLGSRASVDQALSRLARKGTIRRLDRGVYDFPRRRPGGRVLYPRLKDLVKGIGVPGSALQPVGAKAANDLGLTTQVPANVVFLTDGPDRDVQVGNLTVQLKHSSPRQLVGSGGPAGVVIQALRYLGRSGVDDSVVSHLRSNLDQGTKDDLKKQADANRHLIADWILGVVDQIANVPH